ncbi:hypothetical protein [Lysobacter capsici]|uniref:hypothetical protein n=1 Tax=Lysobacter capsici TaxID=435897 RepID=UPI001BFFECCE|nr:hypothetical protein [Lysobacter capsici]QWF16958.1 hypothetical protein KME82_25045 [Lysobacter capsici]
MNPLLTSLIQQVPELLPIALMIVIPIMVIFGWLRYRTGRMRLDLQATARLYKKVANEPLGDQMSAAKAFGFIMHPRVLKIARERDDPLAFINSYKRARRYVRYEQGRIVSWNTSAPLSFKTQAMSLAWGSIGLLLLPWLTLVAHPWLPLSHDAQIAIVLFQILMWFATPAAMGVADNLMHAYWLTERFNERYPPAGPEPVVSIASTKRSTRSQVKQNEKSPHSRIE